MSGRVVECQRCAKHWNVKFNRRCPRCGAADIPVNGEAASPEQLQKLRERFQ